MWTYKLIPPDGFVMPIPYYEPLIYGDWTLELGNPHPNIVKIVKGYSPSNVLNKALSFSQDIAKSIYSVK